MTLSCRSGSFKKKFSGKIRIDLKLKDYIILQNLKFLVGLVHFAILFLILREVFRCLVSSKTEIFPELGLSYIVT